MNWESEFASWLALSAPVHAKQSQRLHSSQPNSCMPRSEETPQRSQRLGLSESSPPPSLSSSALSSTSPGRERSMVLSAA